MRAMGLFAFCAVAVVGCSNEIPGESRLPRCEPRSHVDPGRLNIDSAAEDYAVVAPCRAALQFYIAGSTNLRGVAGEVDFDHFEGEPLASEAFELEFSAPMGGMFSETAALAPVEGHMCRELMVTVSRLACRDGDGNPIECPAVRLKTSYVFEDFLVDAAGLDVCFD